MEDDFCWTEATLATNDLAVPLYAEGQLVRAADLTLDRRAHDLELARLRRFLHGWGIVAGLALELDADLLSIGAGYGICPSGAEIYLPEEVLLRDLSALMATACGPESPGCALDGAARTEAPLQVWLLAVPVQTPAAPRPAWPSGCDHPGNHLAPSLSCGGVSLRLACSAPPRHSPTAQSCDRLREILCHGQSIALPAPHPAPDLLVLGKLTRTDGRISLDTTMRRPLLPVSVLQDFVLACGCDPTAPAPGGGGDSLGGSGTDPVLVDPDTPVDTRPRPGKTSDRFDWLAAAEILKKRALAREKSKILPDKGDPVMSRAEAVILAEAGLSIEEVLTADPASLTGRSGLAPQRIAQIRASLGEVRQRLDMAGF